MASQISGPAFSSIFADPFQPKPYTCAVWADRRTWKRWQNLFRRRRCHLEKNIVIRMHLAFTPTDVESQQSLLIHFWIPDESPCILFWLFIPLRHQCLAKKFEGPTCKGCFWVLSLGCHTFVKHRKGEIEHMQFKHLHVRVLKHMRILVLILVPAYTNHCGWVLIWQFLWGRKWSIFLPHKNPTPRYHNEH